ncbi:hypothetical protein BV96_03352 [Sphingomonas paucimobilis]|nr:hypothetical protein BV96_03352 [Sphingomonas paucimobilis]
MGFIDDIETALHMAGIAHTSGPGSPLRRGWDYWIPDKPEMRRLQATDGRGIARTPHPHILHNERLPDGARPILDVDMNGMALHGGIWRQCLIRPGDANADNHEDPFAVSAITAFCSRAERLVALIGHQPRDLALYLVDVRKRDKKLFRLLLAKDFLGALAHNYGVLDDPWPASVQRLWQRREQDYLPPFLVAALYAELPRAAMNQAGLIEMSVDGETLTIKRMADRLPMAGSELEPMAIQRLIDHLPFQSFALDVPDELRAEGSLSAACDWIQTEAAHVALVHGVHNAIDIRPSSPAEAKHLQTLFMRHPTSAKMHRQGHGEAFPRYDAVSFWGLTWRKNAAVRLLEIATTARQWNRMRRSHGPDLGAMPRHLLAKAIAVISYGWVAEQDRRVALSVLGEMLSKEVKAELSFEKWHPFAANPMAIDDHLGARSGEDMLGEAEAVLPALPQPFEYGYTARSQAKLWLNNHGDDIEQYNRFQAMALERHALATARLSQISIGKAARVSDNVVTLIGREYGIAGKSEHGQPGHNQPTIPPMTDDPDAARAAQLIGQQISALSTEPIHAKHIRDRHKRVRKDSKSE